MFWGGFAGVLIMIFNPYAFIDLAGFIITILLLIIIYKAISDRKLRIRIFHLYIFASLMLLSEFLAESLSDKKYYTLIIRLIEFEFLFGTLTFSFLFYTIIYFTSTKVKKIFLYLTLLFPLSFLLSIIFYPGKYTITGLKQIPTGYFGIYGILINPVSIIYVGTVLFFIIFFLLKKIQTGSDKFLKIKLRYILASLIIFLILSFLFIVIQAIFEIYYLSVGGINFFTLFLAFLTFIFVSRNLSNINYLIRNKILFSIIHIAIIAFFIFLFFLLKNIWNIFIRDKAIIFDIIFIIFASSYLFYFYNKMRTWASKLLYITPATLWESAQQFSKLLENRDNLPDLRKILWLWFEENMPINSIKFYSIETGRLKKVEEFGNKTTDDNRRMLKNLIKSDSAPFIFHTTRIFSIIRINNRPIELVIINNFPDLKFRQEDIDILKIILCYYRVFYINLYLNEKVKIRSKLNLLNRLTKNLNLILTETKKRIMAINYNMKKEEIIVQLNKIITMFKRVL